MLQASTSGVEQGFSKTADAVGRGASSEETDAILSGQVHADQADKTRIGDDREGSKASLSEVCPRPAERSFGLSDLIRLFKILKTP